MQISCGKCHDCMLSRTRDWAIRVLHEAQAPHEVSTDACFVTLTYDEEHLPASGGLEVEDWKLFAKRLRKRG